jgi:hypothetical protein
MDFESGSFLSSWPMRKDNSCNHGVCERNIIALVRCSSVVMVPAKNQGFHHGLCVRIILVIMVFEYVEGIS